MRGIFKLIESKKRTRSKTAYPGVKINFTKRKGRSGEYAITMRIILGYEVIEKLSLQARDKVSIYVNEEADQIVLYKNFNGEGYSLVPVHKTLVVCFVVSKDHPTEKLLPSNGDFSTAPKRFSFIDNWIGNGSGDTALLIDLVDPIRF